MNSKGGNHFVLGLGLALLCLFMSGQAAFAQQPPTCTETWRKADGPHVISNTVTISSDQTVCVEPGVRIQFGSNGKLLLYGRLVGAGTSTDRITVVGSNVFPNRVEVVGTMDLRFADVSVPLNINPGGSLLCRDCRFRAFGTIITLFGVVNNYDARYLLLEDCVFDSNAQYQSDNASVYVSEITAILRNVTFNNAAWCFITKAYLYTENVASQNSRTYGLQLIQDGYQPQLLDGLNITNSASACLRLDNGNFEIGPNVVLQNCKYPVESGGGGLMPGSHIPSTGNQNNWINAILFAGYSVYAPFEIPYVVESSADLSLLEILPGVRIKARPNFYFYTEVGPARVLGLPQAPIVIEPFTPGQKWTSGQFNSSGDRMEYVVLDGSRFGIVNAGGGGASYYVDNSIFRNNDIAVSAPRYHVAYLQGNLFTQNGIALNAEVSGGIRAAGQTNPNLFENNTLAVKKEFTVAAPDVRFNWWNSPTGPTTPDNPGGTGDRIEGTAEFRPFRTERPDTTDHPPVVRLPRRPYRQTAGNYDGLIEANQKVILTWNAFDDRAIVKQKILFSSNENYKENFAVVADNLPPGQREYEFTMPNVATSGGQHKVIRVVAVDEKGQEGWDEWQVLVPTGTEPGGLVITSPVGGQTLRGGQELRINYRVTNAFRNTQFQIYLVLDADHKLILVANGDQNGAFSTAKLPYVSTDSARIAINSQGSINNQKWFFSEPFAIRPDSRWVNAPPTINMTSPTAGQHFQPGSTIPISWAAADDEALRGFTIMVSTDRGRTWLTLVENLPPTATSYDWQTPPGTGFDDVRVRVIAFDRRFQNSSDGANRSFSTTNTQPDTPPTVELTFPANGSSYLVGQSVFVAANAADGDGTIARVEFYDGLEMIGLDASAPYQVGLNYLSAGTHTLTARAYDNLGASTVSNPVSITVSTRPGPAPLPINEPSLSSPVDGATFNAPANITISAVTQGASVARVEFYHETTLIDSDTTAPYEVSWNDVPAGRYTIFAKTIATSGAEAISEPVDIVVNSATAPRRAFADFDGDGRTDVSVFRPSNDVWYLKRSSAGFLAVSFGLSTDQLVPADYDGDGRADVAVFRPQSGNWYIVRSSSGEVTGPQWGQNGDLPVPADYDGDRKADLAVFRGGTWYISRSSDSQFQAVAWGLSSDVPVPADYDGDGRTDVAVFRPQNGTWYILRSSDAGVNAAQWGQSGDLPVPGDYDGDGRSDLAVYRGGIWYLQQTSAGFSASTFGLASDIPARGDFDGDGRADIAVFREGMWYGQGSATGYWESQFGLSNDLPVAAVRMPSSVRVP